MMGPPYPSSFNAPVSYAMAPQLEVSDGRRLRVEGELLLGRGVDGDGRLQDDPDVSARHARMRRGGGGELWVEDLGSANGTWVNGRRIQSPHPLRPGDRVRIGATMLVVTEPFEHAFDDTASMPAAMPPEPRAAQAPQELEVVAGGDVGRRIALDGELLLGRTVDGDGRLGDDPETSRRHARVRRGEDGGLIVEDLGSANGTFVNGERIDERRRLGPGDELRIGHTTMRVTDAVAPARDPVVQPREDATRISPRPEPPAPTLPEGDQLKVIAGKTAGRRLDPGPELVLGRTVEGDGQLGDDPEASRKHARVRRGEEGELLIEDLGSANGTWVNGERVEGVRALVPGDSVKIGQTIILVTDPLGKLPSPTHPSADIEPAAPEPVGEQLELVSGAGAGRRIELDGDVLLGRAVAGEGRLNDDPEVSRRHARIRRGPDGTLTVEDLSSGNGTWLNGGRVDETLALAPGDRLKIGQTVFAVTDVYGELPDTDTQRSRVRDRPKEGAMRALGGVLQRRRWVVLALVVVFLGVAGAYGLKVATLLSQGNDFNDPAAASVLAEQRLADAAGAQPAAGVLALVTAPEGKVGDPDLDAKAQRSATRARKAQRKAERAQEQAQTPEDAAEAEQLAADAQEAKDSADAADNRAGSARNAETQKKVESVQKTLEDDPAVDRTLTYYETQSPSFVSDDRRKTYVAAFLKPDIDQEELKDRLEEKLGDDRQVKLGGSALAGPAVGEQAEEDLRAAEMIALPLLFLCSLFVFRGVVAAMLPVFVGIITVLGTFLGLRIANEITLQSIFALNMVVGLGLGLAIDYSLFILSRYREELARHGPGAEPLKRTIATAGRTVLFSAATVSAALASLLVFPQRFLASMGTGGLICTVVAAATALIALPALLAVLGPRVNALAPKRWQREAQLAARGEHAGFWYRLSRGVMRRPLPVAILASGILIAAGLPFLTVQFTGVDASVLPTSSPVRQVDLALDREFSDSPVAPITVAVDAPSNAQDRLDDYAADLRELPNVESVSKPDNLKGNTWQIDVTPERDTFDSRTLDLVDSIRDGKAPFPVDPAGESASFVDQQASLAEELPVALGILITTTVVILFVLTGSVVLPVKSVLMNFLGLSATFGLLVLIFQDGFLSGPLDFEKGAINATQPILLFIVAFGLSTDYGVFLLTRIKEQHDAGAPNKEAVATGLERTGRIVTAAALLFSVALGAFATSEIVFIKLVGVGAVLAVLIDSSIIRALLVPALMALLGTRNWWAPKPLRRVYERIGLSEA
jgi:RND superfamily putative drug exporter